MQKNASLFTYMEEDRGKPGRRSRLQWLLPFLLFSSIFLPLLSACGGDTTAIKQADQSRMSLDQALQHAQSIGVPQSSLHTIIAQKTDLDQTKAPLTLFSDQAATDYFHQLTVRYQQLTVQTQGVVAVTGERFKVQAQSDLLALQQTLASQQAAGYNTTAFAQVYKQASTKMDGAKNPGDFATVSTQARDATQGLNLLPTTMDKLKTLGDVIALLEEDKQDVSSLKQQYASDQAAIKTADTYAGLTQIGQNIDKENQQVAESYQDLIPKLAQKKVDALAANVDEMRTDGIDVTPYQKLLDADRNKQANVKTMEDYLALSKQVAADQASLQNDLIKGRAISSVKEFHKAVDDWGNAHMYHDPYDGKDYPLNNAYMDKGIGEDLDRDLNAAKTTADYQQVLTDTKNEMFHLSMLKADYGDKTPFDQVHQTDMQLIDHYNLQSAQVIVVSTVNQALRLYENGKLVKGFQVTAGRPELPTVPGLWRPLWRLTKTEFKSPYPKGSPYYYEPTKINYAILYHEGGYYLHDSWWRNDYGPGTQFYHVDSSGNTSASYGTHGCVNIREDLAAWLYDRTSYDTAIIIY